MKTTQYRSLIFAMAVGAAVAAPARAWDEDGHAVVTLLAHDKIPPDMPDWLRTPEVRARLVYLSAEPDRWRGQHHVQVDHCNSPNHYIDAEDLAEVGLSLATLPPLRRQFTDLLAEHRAKHPTTQPTGERRDTAYTNNVPGLLPYEIAELQWKIAASWTQLKTYEAYPDRVSPTMIRNARENIVYHMGILSHFIGDGSQPLHLTKHHNGWVGDNPNNYTTDRRFHAFIDDGILSHHRISYDDLIDRAKPARSVSTEDYWRDINAYLTESFELVEPLYKLEKNGDLRNADGKRFIEERFIEAGAMLAGVWEAGYRGARIDDFRVKRLRERKATTPGRRERSDDEKESAESRP